MTVHQKNYSAEHIGPLEDLLQRNFMGFNGKYFIGSELGLTGCEVSLNRLPAGKGMPFVHTHTKNEELEAPRSARQRHNSHVDGEEFPIREGSLIRVAPAGNEPERPGKKTCTSSAFRPRRAA